MYVNKYSSRFKDFRGKIKRGINKAAEKELVEDSK